MNAPVIALNPPSPRSAGVDVCAHVVSLLRLLRTCTLAPDAAEALVDALANPALWGERPVESWVQLGERVIYGAAPAADRVQQVWRWTRDRLPPCMAVGGPVVPGVAEGWGLVSSSWSQPGILLVWGIEDNAGDPAGAVCLRFRSQRAARAWGSPELGEALVAAAAPRLLTLPLRRPQAAPDRGPLLPVVGRAMAPLVDTLEAYARTEEVILLRGPTGTGKSKLASWCWSRSPRANRRLVVANLLGVPETGQDSELFGVRRGTFTGVGERVGQLQSAHHGTLFIDEIDKLALSTQTRLLRVLDERRYYVVGDTAEHTADVRFIVASNTDLEAAVAERRFLEDLYYRINVMPVTLPALSQRPDEVGPWAQHMAMELHTGRGGRRVALSAEAATLLADQPWPGNLRQLNNVVRRAYAFAIVEASPGETSGVPESLEILGSHARRALGSGLSQAEASAPGPLLDALQRAAVGLVNAALQRRAAGATPLPGRDGDLELADAFRGLVLQVAAERTGDPRKAFALFGIESRLRGGNHLRTWRLAGRQVDALRRTLAEEQP